MTAIFTWKYLHILMFVFWVGTDMGVFLSCKKSTDPKLSIDSRFLLLHMALRIELLPRTMWKAALPLGVMLSQVNGWLSLSDMQLTLVWVFSLAWWGISMTGAWYYDKPMGHTLTKVNNVLTTLVGIGLIWLAYSSAAGNGPFDVDVSWLHWKVGIYGLINLMIVAMLYVFDPMGIAFGRLAVEGSTPEIETTISTIMGRATVTIWTTYILICIVGFIATTKII
ncbi:MAG: hypothetical protein GY727_03990 [Gammaproteobacteria bacterium]|nr:hypothetical protein [Gammaproteobacteria bacterium]MCP4091467.1 hypothetical protein [Gammaproteobacteria bacterium]MCP4275377.1 hypothetical protein [Gammaproteobacteria bacterium]MCP4832207.1 hypothetical protein [Gammaproteobacteria bacterium]MCP4928159.1 hypothetical protein [Gammaproteobacteria bacterium]